MNFPHQRLSTTDKSLKVSIFVIRWICLYINRNILLLMCKIKGLSGSLPIKHFTYQVQFPINVDDTL